jgi:hypothetical protein
MYNFLQRLQNACMLVPKTKHAKQQKQNWKLLIDSTVGLQQSGTYVRTLSFIAPKQN